MDQGTPASAIQPNREEVRLLVQSIGYTEAAQRTGIDRNTLYQWNRRYRWNVPIQHAQETVRSVRTPATAHAEALQEHESETRMSLARAARRMAKDAEQATLRDSDKVYTVAKTMAIVHKQDQQGTGQGFTLNVLNLGALGLTVGDEAPGVQGDIE